MCSRFNFSVLVFIVVRLIDFAGDGFMLHLFINQWLRYFPVRAGSIQNSSIPTDSTYCQPQEFTSFQDNGLNPQNFDSFHVRLLAYGIIVAVALLISPALLPLALPSKDEQDDLSDENDDSSVDFQFRESIKGRKRVLQYLLLVLMVVIHDIPLLALGTDLMTTLISTRGPRCYECLLDSSCSELPLFYPTDYYWLIMMGTKLFGALGCVGYIIYLELQYRYQLHALNGQRRRELLRRHFGQNRRQRRKNTNYCGIWLVAFLATFILLIWTILILLAPTLTVLAIKTIPIQEKIDSTFGEIFEIGSFVCWGAVGMLVLIIITDLCCFATRKKHCFSASQEDREE